MPPIPSLFQNRRLVGLGRGSKIKELLAQFSKNWRGNVLFFSIYYINQKGQTAILSTSLYSFKLHTSVDTSYTTSQNGPVFFFIFFI